jgi:AbrB family looped-hinge helix DNA binding protein
MPMPLVKIKEKYQVTLPAAIRKQLALQVGDLLEVKLKGTDIVLKPKAVIDKTPAWERLLAVLAAVHQQNRGIDPAQVEQDVLEAIRKVRQRGPRQAQRRAR